MASLRKVFTVILLCAAFGLILSQVENSKASNVIVRASIPKVVMLTIPNSTNELPTNDNQIVVHSNKSWTLVVSQNNQYINHFDSIKHESFIDTNLGELEQKKSFTYTIL